MSIQIIITGEHATDALAELQTIARALVQSTIQETPIDLQVPNIGNLSAIQIGDAVFNVDHPIQETNNTPVIERKRSSRAKKKDTVTEPTIAQSVAEATAQQILNSTVDELDDVGPIVAPAEPVTKALDHDALKDLITTVGKNEKGDTDPAKYAKMRNIMKNHIPAGQDIKIPNIPLDKITEVYYEIAAL